MGEIEENKIHVIHLSPWIRTICFSSWTRRSRCARPFTDNVPRVIAPRDLSDLSPISYASKVPHVLSTASHLLIVARTLEIADRGRNRASETGSLALLARKRMFLRPIRAVERSIFAFLSGSRSTRKSSFLEISENLFVIYHRVDQDCFQIVLSRISIPSNRFRIQYTERRIDITSCNKKLLDGYSVARDMESRRVNLHTLSILYSY